MRDYFRQDFDFDYRQNAQPGASAPSFAFHGQVRDGGGIADLGAALARHPQFARGWTQKLCYWANSQPCSEQDPEFARVAAVFASSHFDFKTLVIELMSSPLVTGATPTLTARDRPSFVSITRRQPSPRSTSSAAPSSATPRAGATTTRTTTSWLCSAGTSNPA
jgi:hypothetical protein